MTVHPGCDASESAVELCSTGQPGAAVPTWSFLDFHDLFQIFGYVASRYNGLDYRGTIQSSGMKKLTLSDYQALAEFRYQIRKFLHFSEQAVEAAGLERGQYQLMLAIKGMPDGVRPRIRELANRMQIQHHSAVELINRLEKRAYVRRERAQDDRREVLLVLTPKGERVLGELALHHHEELRSAAPSLVATLRRLMPGEKETRSRKSEFLSG
jgi:DNA-binding MarR family transcriptional regulator